MKQLIDGIAPIAILSLFMGALWAGHALFVATKTPASRAQVEKSSAELTDHTQTAARDEPAPSQR